MAETGSTRGLTLISNRRLLVIIGVVIAVVLIVFLWSLRGCVSGIKNQNSGYLTIYTGLDLKDTANVVSRLKELKIPYEVKEEGSAIAVPKDKSDEAKLGLAEKNLPIGGSVGWELFNETRMGATDFDRRIQLIRAISGELSRTIKRIRGVEDAHVQIVLPETKLFEVTKSPVTAAVLLKITPGERLTPEQVGGIVKLVSHSVEGLLSENVTIVDNAGNILTSDSTYMEKIPTASELIKKTVQAPIEQEIIKKEGLEETIPNNEVQKSEKAAGSENIIVKGEEEKPESSINTSEVKNEIVKNEEKNIEVIEQFPKVEKKIADLTDSDKNVLKMKAKEEYERQLTAKAQDLLNQFYPEDTIIVRVNVNFGQPPKGKKESKLKINAGSGFIYVPIKDIVVMTLVDENLDLTLRVRKSTYQTIARAVDYDRARGDKIILKRVPFHYAEFPEQKEESKLFGFVIPGIKLNLSYVLLSGIFILVFVFIILVVRRRRLSGRREKEDVVFEKEAPTEGEATATVRKIKDLAKNDPEKIASLLKKWLTEAEG